MSDVKETTRLLGIIQSLSPIDKSYALEIAQKRLDYYRSASSFILSSPKDSTNFILSCLTIVGCYKLADFCFKKHKEFEAATLITGVGVEINKGINKVADEIDNFGSEVDRGVDGIFDGFDEFITKAKQEFGRLKGQKKLPTKAAPKKTAPANIKPANTGGFFNFIKDINSSPANKLHFEMELRKWACIAGVSAAALIGLYSTYKYFHLYFAVLHLKNLKMLRQYIY